MGLSSVPVRFLLIVGAGTPEPFAVGLSRVNLFVPLFRVIACCVRLFAPFSRAYIIIMSSFVPMLRACVFCVSSFTPLLRAFVVIVSSFTPILGASLQTDPCDVALGSAEVASPLLVHLYCTCLF